MEKVRKAWVYIILLLLAVVMMGSGVYLSFQPEGAKRADITWYNQALSDYYEVEYIPPTDFNPAEYPIVNLLKVAAYFQQTASESTDNSVKSLALYNIGTLIGRDYLMFMAERTPALGVAEGMSKLAEAVRIDPNNEDAKYNLEFLEKMYRFIQESGGSPEYLLGGAIMTPPIGFKGY
ncbi:hypothetical protein ACFLUX_00995 [Chloroflexota bacterium]